MAENMMCENHEATNDKFRDNYDKIFGRIIWIDFSADDGGDGSQSKPYNDHRDAIKSVRAPWNDKIYRTEAGK